jgi:glutamine---fructose-6-phosphate transaminase (isomerizing)
MREREARVVAVGDEVDGAALTVRYQHDDVPDVGLLAEALVPELVAARWWLAQGGGSG